MALFPAPVAAMVKYEFEWTADIFADSRSQSSASSLQMQNESI